MLRKVWAFCSDYAPISECTKRMFEQCLTFTGTPDANWFASI